MKNRKISRMVICGIGIMLLALVCGYGTVSYTHLDVYKRQEQRNERKALAAITARTGKRETANIMSL